MSEVIIENKEIVKTQEVEEKKILDMKESGDYPFKSWVTFFAAFTEGLVSEDFGEEYPKYDKILDKYSNYDLINNMMEIYNCDPNEGLYLYIRALCYDGTRYAHDEYDKSIINLFIEKGAEFPTDLLFDSEPEIFDYDIDEEFSNYDIRVLILDDFGEKLKLDVSKYGNWKAIEAKDVGEVEISETEANDEEFMKTVRIQHLKYLSKYLQEIS
jgi:hypothetical protein